MSNAKKAISASGVHKQLTLLDSFPGMAYRCRNTPDWPMLFVSEGSIELTGYGPDELLGGRPHWGDLVHPEDRDTVWQCVQQAIQNGERFEVQYRLATKDKQYKYVWERGSAWDAGEQGTLIEGFITDISPLREKELELERSKEFAAAIIDGAAEGIALVDANCRIESLNRAAARMFRIRSDDATGRHIRDLVSPKDFAKLVHQFRLFKASADSELFNDGLEIDGQRVDGSMFPVHLSVRELNLEHGRRYTALIRDISEQKASEEQIRRQNERLNATVEYSPIGISMADMDLRIIAANSAFANMLGYETAELVGRKFTEFTHPDDMEISEKVAGTSPGTASDHYSIQKRYLHKDGHTVHAVLNVAVGHDSLGNPEFIVANIEDQTKRLTVEAQLREQQDQLTRLDRLSTLGEMMAGIAHEINQPLTAISTYAQSGLRFMDPQNPKPARLQDALVKLSDQARRAGAVVERIRELARQDVSRNELVNVNVLLKQVNELATVDARARGARISLDFAESPPPIWGDPIQLQQVVLNLIRNAIDSMETGAFCNGNELILRTSIDDDGLVVMAVVDRGTGVSEEAAADLFQAFSTHKRKGMGLGLSISRSIVTAHGGQLDYYNHRESGATFFVTLPQASGDMVGET